MITISQAEAYALAVNSVRYCLGRMSYAPAETATIVKGLAPHLDDGMLRVIIRDIEEYVSRRRAGDTWESPYESSADERLWMDLKAHLQGVITGPRDERFRT